jgi:hypothetical protein
MSKVLSEVRSNGAYGPVFPDGNQLNVVEDTEYGPDGMETVSDALRLKAVTQHKTVELPDLVERAQRQVQDHLKSAEQDAATYSDRINLIDAEIEKSENDKEQAEDQVRYWQAVQENTVHVIEVLKQRRAGPQAALDALRKNGIH